MGKEPSVQDLRKLRVSAQQQQRSHMREASQAYMAECTHGWNH
jgi:hypothetical protein